MVVNMAKLTFAVVTIAVLVTVSYAHEILSRLPAYVRLHSEEPFYVAESIDKIAGACVCLLVVWLMFRTGVQGVLRVLGLCASIPRALVFAVIASSLTDCRRNRISRLRCPAIEKQNRLAVLDRSLAVCPSVWLWPRGAGRHVIGKCWIIFSSNCWGCDVRVVGSEMAEPVDASCPACMYELVVGIVFRRKDCHRRLVSIHAPEQHDFTGYPYDPLLHASKNAGCDIAFLKGFLLNWRNSAPWKGAGLRRMKLPHGFERQGLINSCGMH